MTAVEGNDVNLLMVPCVSRYYTVYNYINGYLYTYVKEHLADSKYYSILLQFYMYTVALTLNY